MRRYGALFCYPKIQNATIVTSVVMLLSFGDCMKEDDLNFLLQSIYHLTKNQAIRKIVIGAIAKHKNVSKPKLSVLFVW